MNYFLSDAEYDFQKNKWTSAGKEIDYSRWKNMSSSGITDGQSFFVKGLSSRPSFRLTHGSLLYNFAQLVSFLLKWGLKKLPKTHFYVFFNFAWSVEQRRKIEFNSAHFDIYIVEYMGCQNSV